MSAKPQVIAHRVDRDIRQHSIFGDVYQLGPRVLEPSGQPLVLAEGELFPQPGAIKRELLLQRRHYHLVDAVHAPAPAAPIRPEAFLPEDETEPLDDSPVVRFDPLTGAVLSTPEASEPEHAFGSAASGSAMATWAHKDLAAHAVSLGHPKTVFSKSKAALLELLAGPPAE